MKKEKERTIREFTFGITRQIDVNFRNYALYVLENRGIPNFYDGLTNVQRISLMNAPKTFQKTISLVGACISDGYHHGDKSLGGAINKLAKPFSCGEQLLLGDGYFGTPVNTDASAARYTSVKINPIISEILNRYMVLNKKNGDDQWEWLRTEIPVGLLTTVVGLAVGYKSTILPRKLEEIVKFLDGKKATLAPYFKNFTGKISSHLGLKKTWMIEGVIKVDDSAKTIQILELPPLMKYDSFVRKLAKLSESSIDFHVQNDSSDNVDIVLKYRSGGTWEEFKEKIEKSTKMIVTEVLTFVRNNSVIEYSDIVDYLTEFKVHRESVRLERSIYDLGVYNHELEFNKAKVIYLRFMIQKKRSDTEIEVFLSQYTSKIKSRLERIMLRELSSETITKTEALIKEIEKTIKEEELKKASLEASLAQLQKDTPIYSKNTQTGRSVDLFMGEEEEIDGVQVFNPEEEEVENDIVPSEVDE